MAFCRAPSASFQAASWLAHRRSAWALRASSTSLMVLNRSAMPGRLAVKPWSKARQVTSPRRRASSQAASACSRVSRATSLDADAIFRLASIDSIPSRAVPIVSSSSTHVLYICGRFGFGVLEASDPAAGGS